MSAELVQVPADMSGMIAFFTRYQQLERVGPVVVEEQKVKTGGPHDHGSPLDGH